MLYILVFQTFALFWMLHVFFLVIPRLLNFICRRFGSLCLFHLHTYLRVKMEQTECSETSAYKIQTPENYSEERYNIQDTAKVWNQDSKSEHLKNTLFSDMYTNGPTHFSIEKFVVPWPWSLKWMKSNMKILTNLVLQMQGNGPYRLR
jgi:hypothetical protein